MQLFLLLLKIVFVPVWIPYWLLMKCWKVLILLFIGSMIGGCASNSAKLDMSPCACDFKPVNTEHDKGKNHA